MKQTVKKRTDDSTVYFSLTFFLLIFAIVLLGITSIVAVLSGVSLGEGNGIWPLVSIIAGVILCIIIFSGLGRRFFISTRETPRPASLLPERKTRAFEKEIASLNQTGEEFNNHHAGLSDNGAATSDAATSDAATSDAATSDAGGSGEITKAYKALQREIVDRKQVEEQLKVLVTDLERVNSELEDFAYVVSHDLKTPLRGISSLATWLSDDYADKLDDDGREYLDKMRSRTKLLYAFIDGLLKYARIGRSKDKPELLDTTTLVQGIFDSISVPDNVSLRIDGLLPPVTYDKLQFNQLFRHLIENGVKYLGKPEGEVVVSCMTSGDVQEFRVRDNGVGIEVKHFERIFKIFQSLEPRTEMESSGLGLALVKKIVRHNGGKIRVESTAGEGSSFFFTIPVKLPFAAGDCTILIIDDNMAFVKVVTTMLEAGGYKGVYATSGDEAFHILRTHKEPIHATLFDIDIPGENTIERYRKIRNLKGDMKIIVCTGDTTSDVVELLEKEGVDGVLAKPFTITGLNGIMMKAPRKAPLM